MKLLLIAVVGFVSIACIASACDIIVHVKSDTDKKFSAEVAAPNGKKSERWTFTRRREQNTFQQKAKECSLGEWQLKTFNEGGSAAKSVNVTLNGIGRVLYTVNDNLDLTQIERQGATCDGQCAALGKVVQRPPSRPSSPTASTPEPQSV